MTVCSFVALTNVKSQTLQDGINHLYADRFQSAVDVFQKLLAVNPNNIEATYWLGQTYFDMDENAAARQLYDKALMTSANAPLLLVGKGHADLLDKKTDEAKQLFESALTMTRTKKGDDPVILNAIGRANIDAKAGDLAYAIEKLEAAALKDPKNPEIYLNLGNAYRKARPGEGGGQAYTYYKKALEVNPNFALAYVRIAKLFATQKNKELVLENLNKAISVDPKFSLAFSELFDFYYWDEANFPEAEKYLNLYIESKLPEKDIKDDYKYAQLCYLKKDYACVIAKNQNVIDAEGVHTKPKVFKLMAYAYLDKGDTLNAKKYVDEYFNRKPEEIVPADYVLKANVYSGIPGNLNEVINAFLEAANADTTVTGKIEWLKKGADLLKAKGDRAKESEFRKMIFVTKPNPSNLDIFNWGLAAYFAGNFMLSDSVFKIYTDKYPDQVYGPLWDARSLSRIDTTMEQGLAVPPYQKLLDIADKDKVKFKAEYIEAAGYLAGYSNNILKSKDSALMYVNMILGVDSTNEAWKRTQEQLLKMPAPRQTSPRTGTTSKPSGMIRKNKNALWMRNNLS
jgi:tetratricopeptide (TPR) repeat protein